ncbi:MAG: hypothetical protein LBT85_02060 [Bifidobacteriaceae bacterium]|jgi:hypothetical protein|nr:hypothetical protein [Bifidobacteriaceae bacterium]
MKDKAVNNKKTVADKSKQETEDESNIDKLDQIDLDKIVQEISFMTSELEKLNKDIK